MNKCVFILAICVVGMQVHVGLGLSSSLSKSDLLLLTSWQLLLRFIHPSSNPQLFPGINRQVGGLKPPTPKSWSTDSNLASRYCAAKGNFTGTANWLEFGVVIVGEFTIQWDSKMNRILALAKLCTSEQVPTFFLVSLCRGPVQGNHHAENASVIDGDTSGLPH